MRAKCPRHPACTSTNFGPVQPFGVRKTIIGQRGRCTRLFRVAWRPRWRYLDLTRDLRQDRIERPGEGLMHQRRIVALDEMRIVAVAAQELGQLLAADPRQHRRIGDLEAVEVKDREHRAVARRVKKLVGVPAGGQGAGFRFAIAHDAGDDQVRIVERGAISVQQRIPQFTAFVDGARRFRRYVAGDPVGPGELARKQPLQFGSGCASRWPGNARCTSPRDRLAPPGSGPPMTGTDDVDHVQIVVFDQPVEMDVEKVQPRGGAPIVRAGGAWICSSLSGVSSSGLFFCR